MNKLFYTLLLVILSSNAMAQWVKVSGNDDVQVTVYANPSTITRNGNRVNMGTLWDYKTVHQHPSGGPQYRSVYYDKTYDCNEFQSITKSLYWYSGNMGSGDSWFHDRFWNQPYNWGWTTANRGEVEYDLLKFACAKKVRGAESTPKNERPMVKVETCSFDDATQKMTCGIKMITAEESDKMDAEKDKWIAHDAQGRVIKFDAQNRPIPNK